MYRYENAPGAAWHPGLAEKNLSLARGGDLSGRNENYTVRRIGSITLERHTPLEKLDLLDLASCEYRDLVAGKSDAVNNV
jgi:hypothetical protein